jgi:uncharacterized protein (DUF608 family)
MAKSNIPWTTKELHKQGAVRTFTGEQLREIAFPLGGIGTGCVSLGGWGQLRDWEIFNSPGKNNVNHYSFGTLHARPAGGKSVCKILQGPVAHEYGRNGHGYYRESGSGLPHFRECEFEGSYPFAKVRLRDKAMPLRAELTAWNPYIPLNDKDSSIPCAILQWTLTNPTRKRVQATLFMNLTNMVGHPETGQALNAFRKGQSVRGLAMTTKKHKPDSPRYGTMALTTTAGNVTHLNHWRRSGWFDACTDFWSQAAEGRLDESVRASESPEPRGDTGSIGAKLSLAPGASKTVTMIVTWMMPNVEWTTWTKRPVVWEAYPATQWKDAWDVAEYVAKNLPRLERETRAYADAMNATTLPWQVVEAVTSTSSILKSPTCLRWTNGDFWAWEGCHDRGGCCPGTCTHVWNYQQMMPYLFPSLERSIRETDYRYNQHDGGCMSFRMPLPMGRRAKMHAAADGQFGGIMKVYREWRISGDDEWLARVWPRAKKALEFAWREMDKDRDGVMEGVQHNTYDIEFWGANTMCGSFYLGALRAGEEICRHLGDVASADRYREMFEKGSAWSDKNLFNGEYYFQKVNLKADATVEDGEKAKSMRKRLVEGGRPKYQYGAGCLSDQLLGQLFADMLELGDLYDSRNIDKAAASIFRHNFRSDFYDHVNPQRVYALDDEPGLLLCTWPKGGNEQFPFPYSDEVWTGIEYAVAALLAYRGRIDEALAVTRAVRERYDGTRRNPYDEVECGHHYARAMASYAVLLALSGFAADVPNKRLKFAPRMNQKDFACFFAIDSAWGLYRQKLAGGKSTHEVDARYGKLSVRRLALARPSKGAVRVTMGKKTIPAEIIADGKGCEVVLKRAVTVRPGAPLKITLG